MSSLWPSSFDEDGNKTDWRDHPELEEYISPATGDFMYALPDDPSTEYQMKWIETHPDAVRTILPVDRVFDAMHKMLDCWANQPLFMR